ncbi:hypothetical protein BZG36_01436 [Bifiguratus adelaidae]|uniref:Ubiquinol-cytochrome c chaperone domain-containing protein n=1 Tax=Bifiguratus adelaidae TaxID=1938954 RepID=A0A261Y526_9FUNG|nr:hypothetical protein BZG36_01436 [Bifiguratus adelaidae]
MAASRQALRTSLRLQVACAHVARPMAVTPRWQPLVQKRYTTDVKQPETSPPAKTYSEGTKKLVFGLARLMGYYSTESTAIRASHNLYRICSQQAVHHQAFYQTTCHLPDNFQTWFSITHLHVWMLMVRLRAEKHSKVYIQELVNRFFDDTEQRIRDHGISSGRIVSTYVKDLLAQFHGSVVAYDEGMCKDDPVLAAALWRNLFTTTAGNATDLAYIVQYIRQQLKHLDQIPTEHLTEGNISFTPPMNEFEGPDPKPEQVSKPETITHERS